MKRNIITAVLVLTVVLVLSGCVKEKQKTTYADVTDEFRNLVLGEYASQYEDLEFAYFEALDNSDAESAEQVREHLVSLKRKVEMQNEKYVIEKLGGMEDGGLVSEELIDEIWTLAQKGKYKKAYKLIENYLAETQAKTETEEESETEQRDDVTEPVPDEWDATYGEADEVIPDEFAEQNTDVIMGHWYDGQQHLIEEAVGNYLESFILSVNTKDSSYMLPYVISSGPIYEMQKRYVANMDVHEELLHFSIEEIVCAEDEYECMATVFETYHITSNGKGTDYLEQTATYTLKKDFDGVWKVYELNSVN